MASARTVLAAVALGCLVTAAPAAAHARWRRPTLVRPTTVVADAEHRELILDLRRDYVIKLKRGMTQIPGGLSVWGGHNVVLDGGHINVPDRAGGMVLKSQTGTIWIHGLHISGRRLMEGIDLDERQPHATVVLQNVLIDRVHGSFQTNHADLLQTWAGPSRLLIDGFTGTTDYQGFFLLPNQWFDGPPPQLFELRNVNIVDDGGYALWRSTRPSFPLRLENVYVRPNPAKRDRDWWLWPKPSTGDRSWRSVIASRPPGGNFVRATRGGAAGHQS